MRTFWVTRSKLPQKVKIRRIGTLIIARCGNRIGARPTKHPRATVERVQPGLSDMVRRAIQLLQYNSGGYLLVS